MDEKAKEMKRRSSFRVFDNNGELRGWIYLILVIVCTLVIGAVAVGTIMFMIHDFWKFLKVIGIIVAVIVLIIVGMGTAVWIGMKIEAHKPENWRDFT